MRRAIIDKHKDGDLRTVDKFLFLPKRLSLPLCQQTAYIDEEWRWLEKCKIVKRYSQFCHCWVDSMWED
ncbi:hypothetical protein ACFLQL_00405 [Verrucomicrobiota bacterium]